MVLSCAMCCSGVALTRVDITTIMPFCHRNDLTRCAIVCVAVTQYCLKIAIAGHIHFGLSAPTICMPLTYPLLGERCG
jgi:hypothetical protein